MNYARAMQAPQQPEGSAKETRSRGRASCMGSPSIQPRLNTPAEKS